MSTYRAFTLEGFMKRLKELPADMPIETDDGDRIASVESYRGYYEQASLCKYEGWNNRKPACETVGALLAVVEGAIGKEREGHKGGTYVMHGDVNLWCVRHGSASGVRPIGTWVRGNTVIIVTCSNL